LLAQPVGAEVIDRVLAVVAGRIITLSDVRAADALGLVAVSESGDRVRTVLSELIDRELQLAEVDRFAPPEPSAADLDRELRTVQARFASSEAFEAALAGAGLDLAHLREMLRENLQIRDYLDRRFSVDLTRRQSIVGEWVAGLRRRADIVDLYAVDR
jgi:hypothetical protein